MFKFLSILVFLFGINIQALAVVYHIDEPDSEPVGLVVIAPAKKYLMEERLFVRLAQSLTQQGLIVVRFNWSENTFDDSTQEISRASNDILTAVTAAREAFPFAAQKTSIISKSFATQALGFVLGAAKSQILLTPNCSSEAPFAKTYAPILQLQDVALSIAISNEDPYCDVQQIVQTVSKRSNPPKLFLTHGDHNFVLRNPLADFSDQDQVIAFVTSEVLNDLDL